MDPVRRRTVAVRLAAQQPVHGHRADAGCPPNRADAEATVQQRQDMLPDRGSSSPRLPSAVGDLPCAPPGIVLTRAGRC
jgi:hypothetical protein